MPRGDQLTRQWQLLQMIGRAEGVTVGSAACDLSCTQRTIWRDLQALQAAGFPIYNDRADDGRRSRWRVTEDFRTRLPVKLTLGELLALLLARDALAPAGAGPLGPAIASALSKIEGVMSRDALRLVHAMRERVGAQGIRAKLLEPARELLPVIQEAVATHHRLRIRYHSLHREAETVRDVDPYHLTFFDAGLYLIAHCHLREAVRIFAVERIRGVERRAARFTMPADFDAARYLEGAWGIVRGELVTIRVVFSAQAARYIRERMWHPSQRLHPLGDGRLEMTLRVADTVEVRRWLLGYGVQVEVMEPASLREALWHEARALADQLTPSRRPLATARLEAMRVPQVRTPIPP